MSLHVRRQDMNTRRRRDESRDAMELPSLVNSYSVSSSSQTSGSSRRSRSRGGHRRIDSADNSILRGAEILRRQLNAIDDVEQDEALLGKESFVVEGNGKRLIDDEWHNPWRGDPWSDSTADLEVEIGEGFQRFVSWQERPRSEAHDDFASHGDAEEWAHLSDDDAGAYEDEDEDDEDTLMLLQRASNSMTSPRTSTSMSASPRAVTPDRTPDRTPEKMADSYEEERTQYSLVKRVHEMDTDTFISYDSRYHRPEPAHYMPGDLISTPERNYLPGGLISTPEPKLSTLPPMDANPTIAHVIMDNSNWDDEPVVGTHQNPLDLLKDLQEEEEALQELVEEQDEMSYLLEHTRSDPNVRLMALPIQEPTRFQNVVGPDSPLYDDLVRDPGFQHAQRAGALWQSLVSQHVRFPSKWWNGARSPPLGVPERRMWHYTGRHRVKSNRFLQKQVHNRGAAGKVMLHIIVRDIMTLDPVQDIAIGCFHPNARGVRTTRAFDPALEGKRDIWLAIRRRVDEISVVESLLDRDRSNDASPLGPKHAVNNGNMRAVFGDTPPVQTVFVVESDLYELFSEHVDGTVPPAAILLQRYLPDW